MIPLTAAYAGILTLFYLVLSFRAIGARQTAKVGLGDGGDAALLRRLRVHGNFAEYAPLGLLLMAFAELNAAPAWMIHAIGGPLMAGRLAHAVGFGRKPEWTACRTLGMALTFTALILAAGLNLWLSASSLVAMR
ncbi:MAG: MAPEG family protein [Pseudomonadota bacterium]